MTAESTPKTRPDGWNEPRLVAGLAAGDSPAGAAFVAQAHDAVYAFACRVTTDHHHRQDWTHDVLLRVMDDVRTGAFVYGRPGSFWAWFRKRAWFLVLEANRRERVRAGRETLARDGELPEQPDPGDPQRDLDASETMAALSACLEALANQDHARALYLRTVEDQPYEVIADSLGTPLNTVRAWIRRGRVPLRRCLARRLGWPLPPEDE